MLTKEDVYPSATWKKRTPCGDLYIIVDFKEGGKTIHKIRHGRNSELKCSLKGFFKTITYQVRRDIKQAIKDLKEEKHQDFCDNYSIICHATSCYDAVAQVLKEINAEGQKK